MAFKRRPGKRRKRPLATAPVPEQKGDVTKGVVVEALANAHFRIQLDKPPPKMSADMPAEASAPAGEEEDQPVIAYLAGKMRLHRIRVIVGDTVEVLLDPYGGKPRIVRRL
ncbi:MAG TPA: hypothetical protein VJ837_03890 [Candidatus Paceibacterota bacterium]|nr:hypothetical protein [Candidatus Paceibacterota bacterium]